MTEMLMARDYPAHVQRFLYACAFWTIAADERLDSGEQTWVERQFGDAAPALLREFMALQGEQFFTVFAACVAALTDDDKRRVYPRLDNWLSACATADGASAIEEAKIIDRIRTRIALDAELTRLADGPEPEPTASHGELTARPLTGHGASVLAVSFSPDGALLASGAENGTVRIWRLPSGELLAEPPDQDGGVTAVGFLPDGSRLVTADRYGTVRCLSLPDAGVVWQTAAAGHGGITSLTVSPDGSRVACGSDVGPIAMFRLSDGTYEGSLPERHAAGSVRGVAFTPDGKRLAAGGDERLLCVWDLATGSRLAALSGHDDGILSVDVATDGTRAVTAGRDNDVRIWDLNAGMAGAVLSGHTFTVYCVHFTPDGNGVVSASWDHTVRLWDVATGAELLRYECDSGGFSSVDISPCGNRLAAGNGDGLLYILECG